MKNPEKQKRQTVDKRNKRQNTTKKTPNETPSNQNKTKKRKRQRRENIKVSQSNPFFQMIFHM